jgi:hypothetical protein
MFVKENCLNGAPGWGRGKGKSDGGVNIFEIHYIYIYMYIYSILFKREEDWLRKKNRGSEFGQSILYVCM